MQSYSIITLCTKNYRDAFKFVIDSWLRTEVKKIYVYTDDTEWISNNERIEIVHYFKPSTDWLSNVGKKVITCIHATKKELAPSDNIIFIDIDCYITTDLGHVFDNDFDIAATRVDELELDTSTGIFFFRNSNKIRQLFVDWQSHQEVVRKNKRGVKERCGAYEQIAFSELIRKRRNNDLNILSLNADWYNRKTRLELINHEALRDKRLKVLHFYRVSYRDGKCIEEVNKTIDLKTGKLR